MSKTGLAVTIAAPSGVDVKLPARKDRGDTVHEVEKLDAATSF